MGAPQIPRAEIKQAVRLVEAMLRKGYPPKGSRGSQKFTAICAAAKEAERKGYAIKAGGEYWIRNRIKKAERLGVGPNWLLKPKRKTLKTPARAELAEATRADGDAVMVLVIPDTHLAPDVPSERMAWLGAWARDLAPDYVVQLGDLGTWDSVTTHAPPGTLEFEGLPRVTADFEAVKRGLDDFERRAGNLKARRIVTKGNHEYRLDRFEDNHPQIQGMLTGKLDDLLSERDWASKPYREYQMISGVGFIHIPINAGGKPYGGKMSAHAIARDAMFSIVHGHTHVRQSTHVAKLGRSQLVSVISPGCALPPGHVEPYAQHSATGWFWGATCLTIRDGVILDENSVSMETLRRRYGTKIGSTRLVR